MIKRRVIVSAILAFFLVLGSFIDKWAGFSKSYFAISFASVICLYWIAEFIIDTIEYYKTYKPEFQLYVAEKVNKTDLSYEIIMSKKNYYYRQFKKSKLGGKFYQYVKIFFAFGLAIVFFSYLF